MSNPHSRPPPPTHSWSLLQSPPLSLRHDCQLALPWYPNALPAYANSGFSSMLSGPNHELRLFDKGSCYTAQPGPPASPPGSGEDSYVLPYVALYFTPFPV